MYKTHHFKARASQRAISQEMIDLVLEFGVRVRNQVVLSRNHAEGMLREIKRLMRRSRLPQAPPPLRALRHVLDKGGLVVVEVEGVLVTAYAYGGRRRLR